jgi:hypothetical protein
MFEAHWIRVDDESVGVVVEYSTTATTEIMQVPGGIVVKTSRADFLKNGRPAGSSCAMVFIPYVTVQVIDGHVMMDSTSAEAAAHTGTAMIDAMTKQLKKRGF